MSGYQPSFDSPVPIPADDPSRLAANPLVRAIVLLNDAAEQVDALSEPYRNAELELIQLRKERDELSIALKRKQDEMDRAMRTRHDIARRRDESINVMNEISKTVKEMGGVPMGNRRYVTPEKAELFTSGRYRYMDAAEWEAMY